MERVILENALRNAREHASFDIFERCALMEKVLKCCLKRD
tara:strand:+ start:58 stop:177 length:120 start_codon:yes stop_codon:yes gene_type:complete